MEPLFQYVLTQEKDFTYTYKIHLSMAHPDRFALYERYKDLASMEKHKESPAMKRWLAVMTERELIEDFQLNQYAEFAKFGFTCRHEQPDVQQQRNKATNTDNTTVRESNGVINTSTFL